MDMMPEEMEQTRIARWGQVKPYDQAFIESRLPNMEKRLYKLINRGLLENKGVVPAIDGEHRFSVSIIEVPVGGGAGLHAHATEEIFFPLNGDMVLIWGEDGSHSTVLKQWDCVSVPVGMMRGFRNPNDHDLLIYAVVGGNDTEIGRIEWHTDVLEAAAKTGLVLDDEGRMVEIDVG